VEMTLEQKRAIAIATARARAAGAPAEPVSTATDVAKSGMSGLFSSIAQIGGQFNPADVPLRMIRQAADVGEGFMDLTRGKLPQINPSETAAPGSPTGELLTNAAGQNYTPQTAAGRWTKTGMAMAPAALAPGSIPQRIANVAGPTVGAQGLTDIVSSLGGDEQAQQIAGIVGGLGGGAAVNSRFTSQPRAIPKVDDQALAYVNRVAGKTDLAAVRGADPQLTGAEALGQPGKAGLGALARQEGATGENLNTAVFARRQGRPDQLLTTFAKATGVSPEAAAGDMQALVDAGRVRAAPLYEKAYASGPIDSPHLQVLEARPSMQRAMARAMRIAAEEGREPNDLGFRVVKRAGTPEEIKTKRTAQFDLGSGRSMTREVVDTSHGPVPLEDVMIQVERPSAHTYDYVKRGLDDILNTYRDKTTGKLVLDEEGRAILGTLNNMRSELVKANPDYGRALAASGDYLSADTAFRNGGRDVFNPNLTERQITEKFGKMSEGERDAYKGGIANRFYDLAQNGKLDPKLLRTPRVRAKLAVALGREGAQHLIDFAQLHGDMAAFEGRYAPGAGSVTSEMAAAMRMQEGGGNPLVEFGGDLIKSKGNPLSAGASFLGRKALAGYEGTLGKARFMDTAARDKAGETLMLSPQEMAAAIESYRAIPKRGFPAITAGGSTVKGLFGSGHP